MPSKPFGLWLLIICLAFIAVAFSPAPVRSSGEPPTPTPLNIGGIFPQLTPVPAILSNPDFEAGLTGWQTWHEDTGKPARAGSLDYAIEPAFSTERNPALIKSGSASLHIGRIYDPWHAGLKRAAMVTPRSTVRFCMDGRLYASNRDFGHEPSWASIDGQMQVGLLIGDGDWTAAAITWSAPVNPHDDWLEMCVESTAGDTGRLTLFTSVNYRGQAAKHLDAWWDAASLSVMRGNGPNALPAGWPSSNAQLTTTQPISVLLLIPSTSITAYTVLPAQMFATSQEITLALSSGSALPALSVPPLLISSPTPTIGDSTLAPTLTPTRPTLTPDRPTVTPTNAVAMDITSPTPRPTTTAHSVVTPYATDGPEIDLGRPASISLVGAGGLAGLLLLGLGSALYVIRHR